MCNRIDCAGVWAGELACARCREGKMELNERQIKILHRVREGGVCVTYHSGISTDTDYQELMSADLIDCSNCGYSQPTSFLTEKGEQALREVIQ